MALTTYPLTMQRLKKEQSYTSTSYLGLHGLFWGEHYLFTFDKMASYPRQEYSSHCHIEYPKSHTSIVHLSGLFLLRVPTKSCMQFIFLYAFYMFWTSYPVWYNHLNNISCNLQILKFTVNMIFSLAVLQHLPWTDKSLLDIWIHKLGYTYRLLSG
jgi:hypothetical protein